MDIVTGENSSKDVVQELRALRQDLVELHKSLNKSGVSGKKLEQLVFFVSTVQLLVALIQFIISFAYTDNIQMKIFGIVMSLLIIGFVVVFNFIFLKSKKHKTVSGQ